MAVFFPSLDALRLALTSGAVPAPVCMAPVTAAAATRSACWFSLSVMAPST